MTWREQFESLGLRVAQRPYRDAWHHALDPNRVGYVVDLDSGRFVRLGDPTVYEFAAFAPAAEIPDNFVARCVAAGFTRTPCDADGPHGNWFAARGDARYVLNEPTQTIICYSDRPWSKWRLSDFTGEPELRVEPIECETPPAPARPLVFYEPPAEVEHSGARVPMDLF